MINRLKRFCEQWFFILGCRIAGHSLLESRWRWNLRCLNEATKRIKGHETGMGDYAVVLKDGTRYPNREE